MKIIQLLSSALIVIMHFYASAQTPGKPVPVLDHIALYVKNLDSSIAFYTKIFQLESDSQPFKNLPVKWYKLSPGLQLHLIQGAKKNVEVPELSHICFSVKSLTDFITILEQNRIPYDDSQGNKNTIQHRPDGVNQIFIQDPDGYWIEVNDKTHS